MAIVVTLPIPLGNWLARLRDRAARPGAVRARRHPVRNRAAPSASYRWRSSPRSSAQPALRHTRFTAGFSRLNATRLCARFAAASGSSPSVPPLSFLRHRVASHLNARASSHNKRPAALTAMLKPRSSENFMADLIIVYWRDIPAQVIVKKGRQNAKRELPLRFTEAIDMCAMRIGAGEHRRLSRRMAQGRSGPGRRRPRSRGRQGFRRASTRNMTGSGWSLW